MNEATDQDLFELLLKLQEKLGDAESMSIIKELEKIVRKAKDDGWVNGYNQGFASGYTRGFDKGLDTYIKRD